MPKEDNLLPCKVNHPVALAGVRRSLIFPTNYIDIKSLLNLLETAKNYDEEKFIIDSFSSVCGITVKVPFAENDVTILQISPYISAKKYTEQHCKAYHQLFNIPIVILGSLRLHYSGLHLQI